MTQVTRADLGGCIAVGRPTPNREGCPAVSVSERGPIGVLRTLQLSQRELPLRQLISIARSC